MSTPVMIRAWSIACSHWAPASASTWVTIERTVAIDSSAEQAAWVDDLIAAGADHIIVMTPAPFDLDPALELKARVG